MCQRVQCPTCGKPTWAGCGLHIEQALKGVPVDERCKCLDSSVSGPPSGQSAGAMRQAPGAGVAPKKTSWLSKLLGR